MRLFREVSEQKVAVRLHSGRQSPPSVHPLLQKTFVVEENQGLALFYPTDSNCNKKHTDGCNNIQDDRCNDKYRQLCVCVKLGLILISLCELRALYWFCFKFCLFLLFFRCNR